ncbi:DUF2732 domain-containing protein [Pantoea sp. SOD02]|uniref:DUF2732 domain-containing protein n=1 Tax=Pantoea sp. SOD02 TaxID=2970818 RepID=UPI0021573C34|nr:DUF2732 domain-containing protein [Pantoea sp. SOD02]UVC28840.1 DUF2732 domain-containing protein [Pantoea sp. SOD02]
MLNNTSQTKQTKSHIELDMMLNYARKEERQNRAELMISRLQMLAWIIRRDEMSCVEAAELLQQEVEKLQAQIEVAF